MRLKRNQIPKTLFEIYKGDGEELRWDIEHTETELRRQVNTSGRHRSPTGVKLVDLLVDQFVFFLAARAQACARGLQGLAALEWAEYLSWPECKRQAGPAWRQKLLKRYAFEEPSCWWQRALQARKPGDQVGVGPPRNAVNWYPIGLQFGPYPTLSGRGRWTKKLHAGVLEAHIQFDPWTTPEALFPVRRLEGPLTWQLELAVARMYAGSFRHARVLIDEPRGYDRAHLIERLQRIIVDLVERLHRHGKRLPPPAIEAWKHTIGRCQLAIRDFERATTTRRRAKAFADHTVLPLEVLMGQIDVVPEDIPVAWLGMCLGFVLERRRVLSVRESRNLHLRAEQFVEDWQEKRFSRRRLDGTAARRVVDRLANLRRPLTGRSVLKYLGKATREAWGRPDAGTHGR